MRTANTVKHLTKGALTYLPGRGRAGVTRATRKADARYCYSAWLRHLSIAAEHGMDGLPRVVAEVGPGDSLGIGLAALLSGADRYVGLEVREHAWNDGNEQVLDELVELFRARADVPGPDEYPRLKPHLADHTFPHAVLPDAVVDEALEPGRVERIRAALRGEPMADPPVRYVAPWATADCIERGSVDLVLSQAVLEHVADVEHTYEAIRSWLRPGGFTSHQIDFKSHGMTPEWNGHWTYGDITWRVIRGRRPWLLNRRPCSEHVRAAETAGLRPVCVRPVVEQAGVDRRRLAPRFADIDEADLETSGVLLQAVRDG